MTTSGDALPNLGSRLHAVWRHVVFRYERFTVPRADNLPTRRVLLAFPAIVLLFGVIVVSFAINGTSSGEMYGKVFAGKDPALIAGQPEIIRSDEWYVNTAWSISQVQQGLPETNHTMPGGMDAALPHDLPRADWSVIFRPQLWGYLFLDVNHATAFKWWIAALTFIAAAYMFLVTVLPRRPVMAAALATGFFFSPFFQWWFQTVIFWPLAWAFVTLTAMLWAVRARTGHSRWIWAVFVAFLTVIMAMGIYAPFIVPVVLLVALFAIGLVIEEKRSGHSWRTLFLHAAPILAAGVTGGVVTLLWLRSKQKVLDGFLATSYPGQRLTETGSAHVATGARTIGSSFSESLSRGNGLLNINASEAATFFLIGAFLIPVVLWIVYRSAKLRAPLPWTLIAMVTFIVIIVAFSYLPGWDAVAHLLFLDRSTDARLRIGLGLASFVMLALIIRHFDDTKTKAGRALSIGSGATFVLSQIAVALAVIHFGGIATLTHDAPTWWLIALISAASIYFIARRRPAIGAALFLVISVTSTITVNPVYIGVFDLRTAPVTQSVQKVNSREVGAWVGIGGVETSAVLMESGVTAFNGMQGAPSLKMWKEIDPTGRYRFNWNRLAGVGWVTGVGEPVVSNPAADQIISTFDACSRFAQKHVDYVLTTDQGITSTCLVAEQAIAAPKETFTIYRVIPRP